MKKKIPYSTDIPHFGKEEIDMEKVMDALTMTFNGLSQCMEALGIGKADKDGGNNPVLMLAAVPGKPVQVVDVDACFAILKNFGISDTVEDTPVPGLFMAYDPTQVAEIGEHGYLIGPIIFYRADADSKDITITAYDVYHVQEMIKEMDANLCADGVDFPAFVLY